MKRRFYADEVLHIYQRTVSGFNIFYSTEDFLVFYTIISVYARRYGITLLGLCQMIDHIHLLGSSCDLQTMSRFISASTSQYERNSTRRQGEQDGCSRRNMEVPSRKKSRRLGRVDALGGAEGGEGISH